MTISIEYQTKMISQVPLIQRRRLKKKRLPIATKFSGILLTFHVISPVDQCILRSLYVIEYIKEPFNRHIDFKSMNWICPEYC